MQSGAAITSPCGKAPGRALSPPAAFGRHRARLASRGPDQRSLEGLLHGGTRPARVESRRNAGSRRARRDRMSGRAPRPHAPRMADHNVKRRPGASGETPAVSERLSSPGALACRQRQERKRLIGESRLMASVAFCYHGPNRPLVQGSCWMVRPTEDARI